MPKSPALRSSLWGLNRARLLTAVIVLAVGALLRFTEAFPYPFGTFAMAVLGGAAACLVLPLGERRGVPLQRIAWFQFGVDAILITGIVTATGGPQSVFIPLYVLLVVASCFVLSGRGGLVVAGICSLLYVLPSRPLELETSTAGDKDKSTLPAVAPGDPSAYVYWSTRLFHDEIKAGDAAYILCTVDNEGIVARGHVVCPQHGWRFSTATGRHEEASEYCLVTYAVRVVGDQIEVDLRPQPRSEP